MSLDLQTACFKSFLSCKCFIWFFKSKLDEKTSDVKTARPGLGRFGPSHFGQAQARPQPGQAGPETFFFFCIFIALS